MGTRKKNKTRKVKRSFRTTGNGGKKDHHDTSPATWGSQTKLMAFMAHCEPGRTRVVSAEDPRERSHEQLGHNSFGRWAFHTTKGVTASAFTRAPEDTDPFILSECIFWGPLEGMQ